MRRVPCNRFQTTVIVFMFTSQLRSKIGEETQELGNQISRDLCFTLIRPPVNKYAAKFTSTRELSIVQIDLEGRIDSLVALVTIDVGLGCYFSSKLGVRSSQSENIPEGRCSLPPDRF